jgi:hypothetical protein
MKTSRGKSKSRNRNRKIKINRNRNRKIKIKINRKIKIKININKKTNINKNNLYIYLQLIIKNNLKLLEIILDNHHHKSMLTLQIKHLIASFLNFFHKQKEKYKHNLQRKIATIKNIKIIHIKKNETIYSQKFYDKCLFNLFKYILLYYFLIKFYRL